MHVGRGRPLPGRGDRELGASLVEVLCAVVVVTITAMALIMAMTNGQQLQQQTGYHADASRAIAEIHATLRSGDLDACVAKFKAQPARTIGTVTVEVRFPEDLLVDLLGTEVPAGWRYRDLDADGYVDLDTTSTASASLVPVTIIAVWAKGRSRSSFLVTEP